MITKAEYEDLRHRIDTWEKARQVFDPKRFAKGGGYSEGDKKNIAAIAGVREPTNDNRSAVEVYEFVHDKPEKLFAYYKLPASGLGGTISTWTGEKLGEIVSRGPETRKGIGGRRFNVRVKAVNGLTYAGMLYVDAGDYVKLKRVGKK